MHKYHVDLMLFGHVHSYERMAPAYRNQTVPSKADGPHYHYHPMAPIEIIGGIPGQ